jgi:hypothetical protein
MAQLCTARSCCLIVKYKFCQNFIVFERYLFNPFQIRF